MAFIIDTGTTLGLVIAITTKRHSAILATSKVRADDGLSSFIRVGGLLGSAMTLSHCPAAVTLLVMMSASPTQASGVSDW